MRWMLVAARVARHVLNYGLVFLALSMADRGLDLLERRLGGIERMMVGINDSQRSLADR